MSARRARGIPKIGANVVRPPYAVVIPSHLAQHVNQEGDASPDLARAMTLLQAHADNMMACLEAASSFVKADPVGVVFVLPDETRMSVLPRSAIMSVVEPIGGDIIDAAKLLVCRPQTAGMLPVLLICSDGLSAGVRIAITPSTTAVPG